MTVEFCTVYSDDHEKTADEIYTPEQLAESLGYFDKKDFPLWLHFHVNHEPGFDSVDIVGVDQKYVSSNDDPEDQKQRIVQFVQDAGIEDIKDRMKFFHKRKEKLFANVNDNDRPEETVYVYALEALGDQNKYEHDEFGNVVGHA